MTTRDILELLRAPNGDWAPWSNRVDPNRDWPQRQEHEGLYQFKDRLGAVVRQIALSQLAERIDRKSL